MFLEGESPTLILHNDFCCILEDSNIDAFKQIWYFGMINYNERFQSWNRD